MLEYVKLENVGPASEMRLDLAPRLNLITGDNGLGKSFLLDVIWWALTMTWARQQISPPASPHGEGRIEYGYATTPDMPAPKENRTHRYNRSQENWLPGYGRNPPPRTGALVLYAQVDGGFSAWDPARNLRTSGPPAYLFKPNEVWDGLSLLGSGLAGAAGATGASGEGLKYCNGLIADWANWQLENGETFGQLRAVLSDLSPSPSELLAPGALAKVSLADARRYPTLKTPYGQEVALPHASAGMRRILALAYMLVWLWQEHVAARRLLGKEPAHKIVFLVDEIEAHLHPQWQRRIVPALLKVMAALTGSRPAETQLIATTHSPLVLASAEPLFDEARDAAFSLNLVNGSVQLAQLPWAKQGDVVSWLVSDAFGLQQGRSLEAERAIEAAEAWMRRDAAALPIGLDTEEAIHAELVRVLASHDPFWPRWVVANESRGPG